MRKQFFLFILLLMGATQLHAEDVSFIINAPRSVVKGAQFQMQYILKNGGSGKNLEVPDEITGFDILFGPSTSTMHSTSIINGKRTSESNTTYTYLLMAKEEGTFTLPSASIRANNANYKSGTAKIKVLPPDKNADPTEPGQQPQAITSKSTAQKVDPNDAFIRAIFSKQKVHEQEAVVATFRFYTVLDIIDVSKIEFPEFEGFMTEDFDMPANRQWEMEHYRGRNYMVLDVKKSLLFPQSPGQSTIPAGKMDIVFEVKSGKVINHPLFGRQEIMTEAKTTLKTSPVTLDIHKLPEGKPLLFSGGVGTFSIESDISSTKVKANDAITLTLKIKGTGNMKLLKNPVLDLDKNFESYDPKITNKFTSGMQGLTGTKTIEYLFIPRYPGKYTIPAVEFSYFDLKTSSYKTVKTEAYKIEVAVDPNAGLSQSTSYNNQQAVKVEQDIRYLKIGDFKFSNPKEFRIANLAYLLWYIIPFILFVGVLVIYRKQVKANADIARMKTRKANKVATKRLRQAKKYLVSHNKDGFYDEVLRAVWGYLSDKLTIPAAELSRENVEIELLRYGAQDDLMREYIEIIDTCEFARYAPSESDQAMDKLYNDTVEAIGKMERTIKLK